MSKKAIQSLMDCGVSVSELKLAVNEMYASSVCNAPANEVDNFTARKLTPSFLALCTFLEIVSKAKKKKKRPDRE